MGTYEYLQSRFARLFALEQQIARITWQQTSGKHLLGLSTSAPGSVGGQISAVLRDPETAEAMRRCLDQLDKFSDEQRRNILFWHSRWWRVNRLPPRLVEELSAACEDCKSAWREARRVDDFTVVLPSFRRVIASMREKADYWREEGMPRYDSLLDVYDPGQRGAELFERHRWLDDATWEDDGVAEDIEFFEKNSWRQPVEKVAEVCGFNLRRGRVDLGAHSMTLTLDAKDIRILLSEKLDRSVLVQLLHEIGHGKMEQSLKRHPIWSWRAHARSQAQHESVARSYETTGLRIVERCLQGNHQLGKHFEQAFRAFSARPVRTAQSMIRLESSGACYDWHIWVRTKIECALIEGDCDPEDLPEIWNQAMLSRFGATPANLRDGCLQDIQWFMGLYGYFPIYWGSSQPAPLTKPIPDLCT